ncbi:mannose-1-phosphate guanylyltransferase [Algoriphagus sp. NG3]|uniref:mannose-1-phosphate guanylyltransferase n=1 Tax=Algoriphagus sp. NG3 TaxID=3097546 RepID=UPI002A7F5ABC|nr:sugar phosphate nucleotidyltransferase [Algoriphagus sp. NG3]WPR77523.1 sugar phosphate nucleotidyltransferase [Algoriphagus sp. NG3]
MQTINVILSGGVGSRLWPLSRKSQPKQYLPIFEGETLFQKTVLRNKEFCESVMVVGNCDNFELSRKDLKSAGVEGFLEIIEACPRNTAAAIAFAAFAAQPEDILFVTPSDHLIKSGEEYDTAVGRAIQLAKEGHIVTFGLKPTKPETGFGYIEAAGEEVKGFREKPNLQTAEAFVKSGNFFWNSGMFCFQAGVYLEELQSFEPEVFTASRTAFGSAKEGKLDYELSMQIPSISVDYAVMERTKKIKVVPSGFAWSDMGSFESIYDHFKSLGHTVDPNGNMVIGTNLHTEFLGLQNTILIQTSDAILVLKKENAQDVKKVYERLEKEKPELVD